MEAGLDLYITNIKDLIKGRKWASLREMVEQLPAPDISDILLGLDKSEQVLFFRFLPKEQSSDVFAHLDPHSKDSLTKLLSDEEIRQLLMKMADEDPQELTDEVFMRLVFDLCKQCKERLTKQFQQGGFFSGEEET